MNKEKMYKELLRYGEIISDTEYKSSFGYERHYRIRFNGKVYKIEMLNGNVMTIQEDYSSCIFFVS